jgi:hypothetical protein
MPRASENGNARRRNSDNGASSLVKQSAAWRSIVPNTIDFLTEGALTLLSDEPLSSATLNVTRVTLQANAGFAGGDVSLSITSGLDVQVFNSLDDVDEDGVLLPEAKKVGVDKLPRMLTLNADAAWVKYRVAAGIRAKSKASLGEAGFNLDAGAGVVLADYRSHASRNRSLREAVLDDLAHEPRTALNLDSVLGMAPGDALTFQAHGSVKAKLTLSFADLFTGQTTALLQLAGVSRSIGFKATAGASVTFEVGVSDEFIVSFARLDQNDWRVGVRKAASRQIGVGVAAELEVSAVNPKELNAFLNQVKDALIGHALDQLSALLAKATLEDLNDTERKVATTLLDRFGLTEGHATLDSLKERIKAIDEGVAAALKQVAESKVKLGFAYEYARIRADVELLQARLDRAQATVLHADLVRLRLQSTVDAINSREPGIALETYLNQQTLKREHSWGFTLGIGKWIDIGGKDTDSLTVVRRRNIEGHLQESFLGTRAYQGRWIGETLNWSADFRADMRGFSRATTPSLAEFDLGLHLAYVSAQKKLSADEIEDYLDFASVWGIVPATDLDERLDQLMEFKDTEQTVAIQITVGDEALRLMLPRLAAASDGDLAGALALAMPRQPKVEGLRSAAERQATYRPVWQVYLKEPEANSLALRATAGQILAREGRVMLASAERTSTSNDVLFPFTMTGRIALDGAPIGPWRQFRNGATLLQQGLVAGGPADPTLDRARKAMRDSWTQVHRLRAIGAFLVESAARAGVLAKIGRSMTVGPPSTEAAGDRQAAIIVA